MRKNAKIIRKFFKVILIFILIIIILEMAVFSAYLYKTKGNIAEATLKLATDIVGEKDTIFVLFLGISDDINAKLTDTIMVGGYNPKSQKSFLVSIPRDTFIGSNYEKANGFDKINSLYQKDVAKTINAVQEITNIPISYYVVINNNAVTYIVDTIGGVEFDVPINMDYDDKTQNLHIHLKKGIQTLDGNEAEQLLRFRHNNNGVSYQASYGDNDFGRMRTQREFLKILTQKVISINDVSKIRDIIYVIFDSLKTNISLKEVLEYVPYAVKFNIDDLKMKQLPGNSKLINNIWFYEYNKIDTKELFNELLDYIEY